MTRDEIIEFIASSINKHMREAVEEGKKTKRTFLIDSAFEELKHKQSFTDADLEIIRDLIAEMVHNRIS